jgi:hypothetical protein
MAGSNVVASTGQKTAMVGEPRRLLGIGGIVILSDGDTGWPRESLHRRHSFVWQQQQPSPATTGRSCPQAMQSGLPPGGAAMLW